MVGWHALCAQMKDLAQAFLLKHMTYLPTLLFKIQYFILHDNVKYFNVSLKGITKAY